jgi:hypothetical protein
VISRVRARNFPFGNRYLVDVLTACASVPLGKLRGSLPWDPLETEAQAVKTSTTLDSDSQRKIPREKFRTKINIPRARGNVRQLGVLTLVQHNSLEQGSAAKIRR